MLYNPGTSVQTFQYQGFGDFLGEMSFTGEGSSCDLKEETLPNFCEPEKEGCFVEKTSSYSKLGASAFTKIFLESIDSPSDEEIEKMLYVQNARKIDKKITRELYFNSARLGFAFIDNKWYLITIDLSDCSA